jgi:DNA-binding phage protein
LVTPLSELLKTADQMIGSSVKEASAKPESFAEKIAAALEMNAQPVEVTPAVAVPNAAELEKIAEAINVLDVAAEIEAIKGIQSFEKKARDNGHSEKDIAEALQKVSAAKLKERMPVMVALGLGLEKKPEAKPLTDRLQAFSRQDATSNSKTQGY